MHIAKSTPKGYKALLAQWTTREFICLCRLDTLCGPLSNARFMIIMTTWKSYRYMYSPGIVSLALFVLNHRVTNNTFNLTCPRTLVGAMFRQVWHLVLEECIRRGIVAQVLFALTLVELVFEFSLDVVTRKIMEMVIFPLRFEMSN